MVTVRLGSLLVAAVFLAIACSGPAAPASFDPSQPCAGADEQRMAGAFPELEASVPAQLEGKPADLRESGRYCSPSTLGKLADAGVKEARFGASTWDRGGGKAVSLVMFEADGLTPQVVFDSYQAGALINSKIHDLSTSSPVIGGQPGHRMDFLNGDSSFQRILVWPGDRDGHVRVLLAADLTDAEIQAAADAFH
ncbi:MAG TPA: hypothetical protein VLR93_03725 [Patescibacteria group bacterium]|nr:hypothetical protein [Patescibacteria group bacterium]